MAADEPDRSGTSDDDREAVDRAFADLIAGYHLTAERPEPPPVAEEAATPGWADDHPLFRYEASPQPTPQPERKAEPESEPESEPEDRYVPPPPEPLPKPAWPVLVAWVAMGYAMLLLLAVVIGLRFPAWAGWLAILGFVGGFGTLLTRLPRERPPDAGDGAVL